MNSQRSASVLLLIVLVFASPAICQTTLIPAGSVWKVLNDGSDQGTAWRNLSYDDSWWQHGPAQLGYGDGDEITVVGYGTNGFSKPITTWFRKTLVLTNADYVTNLNLRLLRDDGAVVYINGAEVFRNNLPLSPINHQTLAINELSFPQEHARVSASVGEPLQNGTNIIAVEIHQADATSRDMSFDLELTADVASSPQQISITRPLDHSYYPLGEQMTFTVKLRGIGGSVSRVDYYSDSTPIGQSSVPPFTFYWSAGLGSYLVTAVAVSESGALATSAPVRVTVTTNAPPQVSMLYPPTDSEWRVGVGVPLNANASDPDSAIQKVRFYENATFIEEDTTFFYSGTWVPSQVGTFQLYAVAYDTHGNTRTSAPVRVQVVTNYVPFIRVISPGNNTVFPPDTVVSAKVNTSDRDGQVVHVQYFMNEYVMFQSFSPPFDGSWLQEAAGEFTLTAVARDASGLVSTSAPVLLTFVAPTLPEISRGPYLQSGNSNSVIVRWRTDNPTDSRIRFGLSGVEQQFADISVRTNHSFQLSGLHPATRYFYSVGTRSDFLAGGESFSFVTSPIEPKAFRVWVLGDSGTANQNARDVRDAFVAIHGGPTPDLWLMLGDNAYGSGTDAEYQLAVFDMYRPTLRSSVLWPTIGNHDANFFGNFPYLDIFTLPTQGEAGGIPSGTEKYYAFDYANVHFICLDSTTSDPSDEGAMCNWLRQDLEANTNQWLVAFWHYPPYTKGSHDSDTEPDLGIMRTNAVRILEEFGVDLVLTGHSHSYERSYLLHGHYGTSDTFGVHHIRQGGSGSVDSGSPYVKAVSDGFYNPGAVYVVAGSSGQIGGGPLNHPAKYISLNELGSLVLDFDGDVLNAFFLQTSGEITDAFTMVKPSRPLRVTRFEHSGEQITITWTSLPGSYYVIEITEDLAFPGWSAITPPIYATSSSTTWSGPIPSPAETVFFRVSKL